MTEFTDKDKEAFKKMYDHLNGFRSTYSHGFNKDFSRKLMDARDAVEDILRVASTKEENSQRDKVKGYC